MFQPERLVLARHRRGLNKGKLAARLGVTAATVTSYERGQREPSEELIQRFADALDFPTTFFLAEIDETVPVGAVSFRALTRTSAAQRDAALAAATLCVELSEWFDARFDLPTPQVPEVDPLVVNAETAAVMVRSSWGLGEAPVPNMLDLLESHGVRVFSLARECREVDAFSFWNRATPFVCLNTSKTAERAIFDAAHELGHLVLHRGHAAPRGRDEEHEANQFASAFLMPKGAVVGLGLSNPPLQDIVRAKARWRVSAAALNHRLHALGCTTDWHYREICIDLSRMGRTKEPSPIEHESSQVLNKMLIALRAEGVRRADIAADLHLYVADLDALLFGLTLSVLDGAGESGPAGGAGLRLVE